MLKTLLIPQKSSRGVICDISTDEKEEILVRWEDEILWWGVMLDILSQAPVSSRGLGLSPSNVMAQGVASKTTVAFNLLSALLRQQKILTSFYLESKWEQLLLHSILTEIGGVCYFNALSLANETIGKMLNDPQRSYMVMIQNDVCSSEVAIRLIGLVQEYIKGQGTSVFSELPSSSIHAEMIMGSVVSVIATLCALCTPSCGYSNGTSYLSSSTSYMSISASHKDPNNMKIISLLKSAINFTSALALSSAQYTHAILHTLNQKFEVSGPRSFCAMLDFSSHSQDGRLNIPLATEIHSLFYSILKSVYDYGVSTTDHEGLLVSIVAYLSTLFIELSGNKGPTAGRAVLKTLCLKGLNLVLLHKISDAEPLGCYFLDQLTHDPRLFKSILEVAVETSLKALQSAPPNPSEGSNTNSKRIFKGGLQSVIGIGVLPIDYSQGHLLVNGEMTGVLVYKLCSIFLIKYSGFPYCVLIVFLILTWLKKDRLRSS
jgi:hypothetical protein